MNKSYWLYVIYLFKKQVLILNKKMCLTKRISAETAAAWINNHNKNHKWTILKLFSLVIKKIQQCQLMFRNFINLLIQHFGEQKINKNQHWFIRPIGGNDFFILQIMQRPLNVKDINFAIIITNPRWNSSLSFVIVMKMWCSPQRRWWICEPIQVC